jgi:peptidoglycan/xylan/chitin deacetylase (PgdA/CDA1 family)
MMPLDFQAQIDYFCQQFEMPTLAEALAFLRGEYKPSRDLCLLTFDDGLKEHFTEVTPILANRKIQGLFGIITSCVEECRVASVHMNHFLMAELPFEEYRHAFLEILSEENRGACVPVPVDQTLAQEFYPLDTQNVASFKYLFNFVLAPQLRDRSVRKLFARCLGDERSFAEELYMSWNEIRDLQQAGMLVAGHSHDHNTLSTLSAGDLAQDLHTCRAILDKRIMPQTLWPFSYPYGKTSSYSNTVIAEIKERGFNCAFDTEASSNSPGANLFKLHRIDCNGALAAIGSPGGLISAPTLA